MAKIEDLNVQPSPYENHDPTFARPDVFDPHPEIPDMYVKNVKKSEIAVHVGALGRPDVYYLAKKNKYYRNPKCTNEFTDEELKNMDLAIPAEIENERRKLRRKVAEGELDLDAQEVYQCTLPNLLEPPEEIKKRLKSLDPIERAIQRINRSTMGRS